MADDASPGSELQAAIPKARWTKQQIQRWDVWVFLVAPLVLFWSMVLVTDPSPGHIGVATIGSLAVGTAYWLRNRSGLHNGDLW
ncbi:MAG TPA: hypothetical protein VGO78_10670 [Acidimicrobiales bacterium]|nr:hypothetical protein [Acidimicrobiales bacterium]